MKSNDNKCDYIMLKTKRNCEKIYYNKYFYVKDYLKNQKQYWRCHYRGCKGRLITEDIENSKKFQENGFHNHIESNDNLQMLLLNEKIKNMAEKTQYPGNKIFQMVTKKENINNIPLIKKENVYKNILNVRKRNSININSETNLFQTIRTWRDENFCYYDSGSLDSERIIIFTTTENIVHLNNSKIWLADGTFKVVPREYTQLYVIFGKIFEKHYPLIFILMKSKNENSYLKFLSVLKENNVKFPKYIILDFELASYSAFKKSTNDTIFYFCMFHYGQCIWRKLRDEGHSQKYRSDIDFKILIRCFLSLSFVPTEHVQMEFEKLKSIFKNNQNYNLTNFINYFEKNFIISKKYPIESWNSYHRILENVDLTTNSAESFNSRFLKFFDQCHSGLITFIENLKNVQSQTEQDIRYTLCNPTILTTEKKQNIYKLNKIKEVCLKYHEYYDIYYLKSISNLYHWNIDL